MTITRMGDELVDMGHNVLVVARFLASLWEGASRWRSRARRSAIDWMNPIWRIASDREHSTREGALRPIGWD